MTLFGNLCSELTILILHQMPLDTLLIVSEASKLGKSYCDSALSLRKELTIKFNNNRRSMSYAGREIVRHRIREVILKCKTLTSLTVLDCIGDTWFLYEILFYDNFIHKLLSVCTQLKFFGNSFGHLGQEERIFELATKLNGKFQPKTFFLNPGLHQQEIWQLCRAVDNLILNDFQPDANYSWLLSDKYKLQKLKYLGIYMHVSSVQILDLGSKLLSAIDETKIRLGVMLDGDIDGHVEVYEKLCAFIKDHQSCELTVNTYVQNVSESFRALVLPLTSKMGVRIYSRPELSVFAQNTGKLETLSVAMPRRYLMDLSKVWPRNVKHFIYKELLTDDPFNILESFLRSPGIKNVTKMRLEIRGRYTAKLMKALSQLKNLTELDLNFCERKFSNEVRIKLADVILGKNPGMKIQISCNRRMHSELIDWIRFEELVD